MRFRPEVALCCLQLAEILAEETEEEVSTVRGRLALVVAECAVMQMRPALEPHMP